MAIYTYATNAQLEAGLKWNRAIIDHLDVISSPDKFEGTDRDGYFGTHLPDHLSTMNAWQAHEAWVKANNAEASGRGLLDTLYFSLKEIDDIKQEMWLRTQD